VSDTVATCTLTTAADAPARCPVTPREGGQYTLRFTAADPAGRAVAAGLYRWVTGADWVPWYDETQLRMDVVADRDRYTVGDTARVMFASPFTDAEAWVTVEREGILEQRRLRITSGTTTLAFPITEAWAPNAFVSIVVSRGRTAPPGRFDDAGRPALRVGYAEVRVTPEVKRLTVAVTPLAAEYRPGDTARVRLRVTDGAGRGARSEVTLWAVDEGVLALTGYQAPDPIALLYAPRGVGVRLGSNLAAVAAQVLEQGTVAIEKGRAPGGGGGFDAEGILRSRFASTAFFLGSVVTDSAGTAVAAAKLPDNLTTFRVMAVAVTAGDRYGGGESSLLVTRPLLARPALPRFVREGDRFEAGAVVNHRLGRAAQVTVEAQAQGVTLSGPRRTRVQLESGRGREVRFPFTGLAGDSAVFRFTVSSGAEADAVEARMPIRPAYHIRTHTAAGTLRDQDTVALTLPVDIDPARSRLEVRLGTSPLTAIRAMNARLRVYPYDCSEQVTSAALPLIALLDAARTLGDSTLAPRSARSDVGRAVAVLARRQGADGGIGFWRADDWTSPWLTAHAGLALLAARDVGVAVSDSVLEGIRNYLTRALRRPQVPALWLDTWFRRERIALGEQLAALDFLTRAGAFDAAAASRLLERAPRLPLADRARLADVLARGGLTAEARRLMESLWSGIRVEGRRATLPADTGLGFYFHAAAREPAAVLAATVAIQPDHPLVSPLVETLLGAVRADRGWNTQDIGAAVPALARLERAQRAAGERDVRVRVAGRALTLPADSSVALTGLLTGRGEEPRRLVVRLAAQQPGPPVFYDVTVREVPSRQPVRPDDAGITVERWYETLADGKPTMRVAPGDLVRVRLRVTVPADRQFVVLDDALPAGLEAVDVSLRTQGEIPGVQADQAGAEGRRGYGLWYGSWWSPFDHREIRDDRVVFAATLLPAGTYWATYVARATTPGTFVRPPAHAEEMYNPAVRGRTEGGTFTVGER
jgi:alpha-2-macroglobulin